MGARLKLRPKNWDSFQHYKDRRPPWIRLYHTLIDDPEFWEMRGDDFRYLAAIWLIASEHQEGDLPPAKTLAFRLRLTVPKTEQLLARLSHWIVYDAGKVLAEPEHVATPEGEAVQSSSDAEGEAPPLDWSQPHEAEIPDGLAIVQYAAFVCEKARIPASYGLKVKFGDAITMLAGLEKCTQAQATALMVPRVLEAQKAGEKLNFWLDDGGWKTKTEVPNGSNKSVTGKRVSDNLRAIAEAAQRRGVPGFDAIGSGNGKALPEPGSDGLNRGNHAGLRAVGPEVLAPESKKGA